MAKKMWEWLHEQMQNNEEASNEIVKQANQKFNNHIAKEGAYDTSKHTFNMSSMLEAKKNVSKESLKEFKKANGLTFIGTAKKMAGDLATRILGGKGDFSTNMLLGKKTNERMQSASFNNLDSPERLKSRADADNFMLNTQMNNKAYKELVKEQTKNTVRYRSNQLQNPNLPEKELLQNTKNENDVLQANLIKDLASKPAEERVAILKNFSGGDENKFRDLNSEILKYKTAMVAKQEGNKINEDLEKGKIGSSVGHVAKAIPVKAIKAMTDPIYATGSLLNLKLPNGSTADQDLKDWKTMSSKYDQTNANIDNKMVRTASGVSGTIGYMMPSIMASIMAPESNLGRISQGVSVGGQSYVENLNEDANNKIASFLTGAGKGYASYAIEGITGGNILGKGSLDDLAAKTIASKTSNALSRKVASTIYEVGGEVFEEELENQVGYLIDNVVNDKGITLNGWLNEQGETVKNTVLTTLALKVMGLGGNTSKKVQEYEDNAEVNHWIGEAEKIINQEKLKIDVEALKAKNNRAEVNNVLDILEKENNTPNLQQNDTQNQKVLTTQQTNSQENKELYIGNKEQIKEDTERFSKQVDEVLKGDFPGRDMLTIGRTPQVLKDIGLKDLPITMTQKHLYTIMNKSGKYKDVNYHDLGIDIVKQLPEALNNPLDVVKSNTKDDSIVLTTYLADKQNRTIIASIKIDGKGIVNNIQIDSNVMTSAYGRNNYEKFMEENIKNGNLLYDIDRGVIKKVTDARLQLPRNSNLTNDVSNINNSISRNEDSVKLNTTNNNYMQEDVNYTPNIQTNDNIAPVGQNVQTKERKHYKTIMESKYTSDEAKAIAKELLGTDTYVPDSNEKQLKRADNIISSMGADTALKSYMGKVGILENDAIMHKDVSVNQKITSTDIAIGNRLIQYYSKTGDKTKLRDAIQAQSMAGTPTAQTLQAMSAIKRQSPEGQALWIQRSINKMNADLRQNRGEKAEQFDFTPEMAEKIVNSKDKEELNNNLNEVYKELGQQVSKTTLQKIDAWRYFSMLANPRTHIRNMVGNTVMAGTQKIKDKVAGVIESGVSVVKPDMERNHTIVPASKEVREFAKNDIKNVADWLGLNENKYNPGSRLESNMRTFKSDVMEYTLGKLFDLNNKLLEAEDGIGLKAGYTKALAEYMTANKLKPDTITDEQLAKARNYAVQQAQEATFHQASSLATFLNQLSKKNGLTKFLLDSILPFKKTPINVAKTGIEYSPVGLVKTLLFDTVQLRKENITVNQYIDNIAKGLTGSGIALLGYALADCGILKASGSEDKDKEQFDAQNGKQAYSITINDKTYSLDWLTPSGIPLFIGAECHAIKKNQKETKTSSSSDDASDYNQYLQSAVNLVDGFTNAMNPMTEMSMLSGVTSALQSYDREKNKMLSNMGLNASKSYVGQFVPTALGQVAKTIDEYERNTTSTKSGLPKIVDSTKNQTMAKIPGLREKLPIKTDIWGNDIKQSENVLERGLKNAVFPWTEKKISSSKVNEELNRLYEKTGEKVILPDTIDKEITIEGQKYRFTNEEYAKYKKEFGQSSYNLIKECTSSKEYSKLNDKQKQKAIEKIYSYGKEKIKIDYAKNNKQALKPSTLYNTLEDLKNNGGKQSEYLSYIGKIDGVEKDKEKNQLLADANYSSKTKSIIYKNTMGKEDTLYNTVLKGSSIDINEYLNYKVKYANEEFSADKDEDGKAISGSAKEKLYNYVNDNITGAENRLLILGYKYKLTDNERDLVVERVKKKCKDKDEAIEIFKKLNKNFVVKDKKVYYK